MEHLVGRPISPRTFQMGTPGIRLALMPVNWLAYQGAMFQGNPFAENVNRYGFRWDLNASGGACEEC